MRRFIRFLLVLMSLFAGLPASGVMAAPYPERPLRLIVPFPPGGGADTVARLLAQPLSASLGQQVVIDNRGGGSTIIGAQLAAESTPDGYTMFFSPNQLVINPLVFPKLPYNPVKDFAALSSVGSAALMLVVNPKLEVKSVAQLIDLAKRQPSKLNVASSGNYGSPHLASELFTHMTHTSMLHVPYKGAGLAFPALVGGQVQLMFATMPSALPHVRADRLRALAVTGANRADAIPNLPTVAETVPGYEITTWYVMVMPAKTPQPYIQRVNADINRILADADFKLALARTGTDPMRSTPEELTRFLRAETKKWGPLLKEIRN